MTIFQQPTFQDLINAQISLLPYIAKTPLLYSPSFYQRYNIFLYLKADSLTETGAFKLRGAMYALTLLSEEQKKQGVVAFSTGNHAQAVAYAGKELGIETVIIMPKTASKIKIKNTKAYGAEVILFDPDRESREEIALSYSDKVLIHPYDDFNVVTGQGVAGIECCEQLQERGITPDAFIGPISGGGYMAGMSIAALACYPDVKLYGVEAKASAPWAQSLEKSTAVHVRSSGSSICDAIMPPTPKPGELPWLMLKDTLSSVVTVDDEDALKGMACAVKYFGLILEPSAAAPLGAILKDTACYQGETIVAMASGRCTSAKMITTSLQYFDKV